MVDRDRRPGHEQRRHAAIDHEQGEQDENGEVRFDPALADVNTQGCHAHGGNRHHDGVCPGCRIAHETRSRAGKHDQARYQRDQQAAVK